jgi:hypothetical protein
MSAIERCPHCFAALAAFTNHFGGVYLQCLDCGYYEAVTAKPDPHPDRVLQVLCADGITRTRRRSSTKTSKRYSDAEGLALLVKLAKKLKRTPKTDEMGKECPSAAWFRDRWGSTRAAIVAAKLKPRKQGTGKTRRAA